MKRRLEEMAENSEEQEQGKSLDDGRRNGDNLTITTVIMKSCQFSIRRKKYRKGS